MDMPGLEMVELMNKSGKVFYSDRITTCSGIGGDISYFCHDVKGQSL